MAEIQPDTAVEPVAAETIDPAAAAGGEPTPPASPPARTWPPRPPTWHGSPPSVR